MLSAPTTAVIATVRAGCRPVRVALSPAGDVLYFAAQGDATLLGFDVSKVLGGELSVIGKNVTGKAYLGKRW
jgi:hypothetical protein